MVALSMGTHTGRLWVHRLHATQARQGGLLRRRCISVAHVHAVTEGVAVLVLARPQAMQQRGLANVTSTEAPASRAGSYRYPDPTDHWAGPAHNYTHFTNTFKKARPFDIRLPCVTELYSKNPTPPGAAQAT